MNNMETEHNIPRQFEYWLMEQVEQQGVTTEDVMNIFLNVWTRLRLILTAEEMYFFIRGAAGQIEHKLKTHEMFLDKDTGEPIVVLTAEQQLPGEPVVFQAPDTIPTDWL